MKCQLSRAAVFAWVMLGLWMWSPVASGQENPADSGQTTRITSSIKLARLVDLTAQLNQIEIKYSSSAFGNKSVTLRLVHEVTPHELWALCLSILHSNELTIIRRPGFKELYAVVTISVAAKEALPASTLDTGPLAPGFQSVIHELKEIDIESLLESVKPILPHGPKLTITAAPGMSGVIVSGIHDRVKYAIDLITTLDDGRGLPVVTGITVTHRPVFEVLAEIKAISMAIANQGGVSLVSNMDADENKQLIRVIGPESEVDLVRELILRADQPSKIATRSYDPRGYPLETVASFLETMARDTSPRGSGEQWKLVQDGLTNTLILSGTPSELEAAQEAVEQLALMPADSRRIIRMIPIKNREASKIREIAGQILNAPLLGGSSDSSQSDGELDRESGQDAAVGQSAQSLSSQFKETRQNDLELAVDNELNTIIATGTLKRIEQLENLIHDLDVRQPQVQLEIVMLSLSDSESRDFGIELAGNIDAGKTLVGLGSLFGLTALNPSSTSAQASGTGGSAVVLSPGDFSVVIRAINTVNDGRSVSMPSIVVNNNESANLNSTSTQPYTTTTITDGNITTARGGSASAGTTITVSPQIAAGDHIVLDYSLTLSSFVGEASSSGVEPPSQQTSLNSIATIPDGYTIVLGGIEITTEGDSDTKTPGLADIPLIGALFKSQSNSSSRSRFYVFIRATVMRSPSFEHLKFLGEELARELDIDDGWPVVEPRIIK